MPGGLLPMVRYGFRGFDPVGKIDLIGARIDDDLDLSGARLVAEGVSLIADRSTIGGAVYFSEGFKSSGEVRLVNAQITSDLICYGATLTSAGEALTLNRANIGGAVYLNQGFESSGTINLSEVQVKGSLYCSDMKLTANDIALNLNGASISGWVFIGERFESSGHVHVIGARIGQGLEFRDVKLTAITHALWVIASDIGGNVILRSGFESRGQISFHGTRIDGDLRFFGAKVDEVSCTNVRVGGDFVWIGIQKSDRTWLNLTGTSLRNLRDDRNSWPLKGRLDLDGLTYEELTMQNPPTPREIESGHYGDGIELSGGERIEWLLRQTRKQQLAPQPWMQLSTFLERKGDRRGAKHVLYRFHRLKARRLEAHPLLWMDELILKTSSLFSQLKSPKRIWPYLRHPNRVLGIAFAWLEESPLRISYSISFVLLLGWLVFGHAGACGALAPTEPEAYKAFRANKPMPAAFPALNPFIYTVENAVPLVRLGQDEKWAPDQRHAPAGWFTGYWFLMWTRWGLILSGWFQATVLAAALSNRFKP